MEQYSKTYEVRWSDMDPNRHLRHSVYLDYAAQTRVALFSDYGLPIDEIAKIGLGPILFREEIKYLREVNAMEKVKIFCELRWMYENGSRWSFFHRMTKNGDTPVAELTVDGAWLDLERRKLGTVSNKMLEIMKQYPRTKDFEWKAQNSESNP
ncbi:acyl-CoA thioesterase [Fodinibius salsisoli]|uniref:Thioesterase family protein n=1 Tax=Fodinibius salsisoli TaxID=2820877 RepID=A0ABT3PLQ4_9BACT|nr:thioesterase family protein [Fodinibius salsisoli]MCW9706119.1 thioesterase family protein [Fodinibius salsisoli]